MAANLRQPVQPSPHLRLGGAQRKSVAITPTWQLASIKSAHQPFHIPCLSSTYWTNLVPQTPLKRTGSANQKAASFISTPPSVFRGPTEDKLNENFSILD